jgi:predicted DNA-binding transcriptional regulator YafY
MSNMERIYQIDQILGAPRIVSRGELQERLGVSWATLKRDIAYMRDRLNAPVVFDRSAGRLPLREDRTAARPHRMNCPACGSPPRRSMPC